MQTHFTGNVGQHASASRNLDPEHGIRQQLDYLAFYFNCVFARHVRNLELANVDLRVEKEDLRPAMICVDVDGLKVDNFKAQLAPNVAAAKLESVKGIVIRNSPVLQGIAEQAR